MLLPPSAAVGLIPALLVAGSVGATGSAPARLERSVYAMGTRLSIDAEGPSDEALRTATEAAFRESERIEAACSTWRPDSSWSRLNRAGGAEVPLDREWLELLSTILDFNRKADGAFDPVLGALLQAWGTRTGGRTPSAEELARARAASGARLLSLDLPRGVARLGHPGAAVEEGGFLKGYALDRMARVLLAAGVRDAVLDFGGQLLVVGRPRSVSLAAPDDRHRATLSFLLGPGSLSSSGTSEHGRHILDPKSGVPSPAWGSVSVVAPDGLTADVLSTALYVMGPERGRAWADAHHVAAIFQRPGRPPLESRSARDLNLHPALATETPR
ncbi:MAG TPA: FAD:protein FMN transferase [Myxococcaceae bacterium]|nr:FAD:protein FMN transferase [Myxococcaceae bacterium]